MPTPKRYSVRPCDEIDNGIPRRVWDVIDNHRREDGIAVSIESWIDTRAKARARARELNAAEDGRAS